MRTQVCVTIPVALSVGAALVALLALLALGVLVAVRRYTKRSVASAVQQLQDEERARMVREREDQHVLLLSLLDQLAGFQFGQDQEFLRHYRVEKAALVRAVKLIAGEISSETFPRHVLDGLTTWAAELEVASSCASSEQWWEKQWCPSPVALGHVLVFQDVATEQWIDWLGYALGTRKKFLLQCLQECLVNEGIYTAIAKRKLTERADADVTGEFRKILILWSTSFAIRQILAIKKKWMSRFHQELEVTALFLDLVVLGEVGRQGTDDFTAALHTRTKELCTVLQEACTQPHAS